MSTNYPSNIDSYTNPTVTDSLSTVSVLHHVQHSNLNDAMTAVQTALGTNPAAGFSNVSNRISSKVPYSGATGGVDLASYNLTAGGLSVATITATAIWQPNSANGNFFGGTVRIGGVSSDSICSGTYFQVSGDSTFYGGLTLTAVGTDETISLRFPPTQYGSIYFQQGDSNGLSSVGFLTMIGQTFSDAARRNNLEFGVLGDHQSLSIRVGPGGQVARFTSSGLGIGTSSPLVMLHITGSVSAGSFLGDGSQLTGLPSSTGQANSGSNIGGGMNVFVHRIGENLIFRSISGGGGVTITQAGSGIEISSVTASGEANTGSNTGAAIGFYRTKTGVNLEFRSLSAGKNLATTTGDLVHTISADFSGLESATAALLTQISSLQSATASLNSHLTGTDSGTGSLQTQIGSLWNSSVPYFGASANVNLGAFSITSATVSSLSLSSRSVSSLTMSAGTSKIATIVFGDGTTMITAPTTGVGEANTAANLTTTGSGTGGVFAQKIGVQLQFKSIIAGNNVGIVESASALTLSSAGGIGSITGTGTANTIAMWISTSGLGNSIIGQSASSIAISGQYFSPIYNNLTATSTAVTINWGLSNVQILGLTGTVTATMTSASAGGRYLLIVKQGGASSLTGGILFTPTSGVNWTNGSAPGLSTSAGTVDLISFVYDGSRFYGGYSISQTASNITYGSGTGGSGSVTSGTNLLTTGSGTAGVFAQSTGSILQFKSLVAGTGINLNESVSSISISLPAVYGEIEMQAGMFDPSAGASSLTGCSVLAGDGDTTNGFTLDYLDFSSTTNQYASGTIHLPPDWDGSTNPKFKLITYSVSSHGSQVAYLGVDCAYVRPNNDSWIGSFGTSAGVVQTYTTANVFQSSSAFSPAIGGSAAGGAELKIRLARFGSSTADTFSGSTRLVKVIMQYKKSTYGNTTSW